MKKSLLLVTIIAMSYQVCLSQVTERPKVAVVLSGGGAKGFAHIGVLKVLEEEGIPIDIIVGTSMGSIVGGLYSIGYTASDIEKMALSEDWAGLLSDEIPRKELDQYSRMEQQRYVLKFPMSEGKKPGIPNGLIKGQNIINLFCGLTANVPVNANFNDFPISFACIGTDLETGEEVLLNTGFLPTAIFSSMAIPGVFVPGEHNGHMLVDGGLVNNFPTDVAKMMGADIIIGVDVTTGLQAGSEIGSINEVMDQLINFYVLKKNSENRTLCDIIIRPNTEGYSISSFNTTSVDTLINRGSKSAKKVINDIRNLKSKNNLQPRTISQELVNPREWQINEISFSGKYSMSEKFLEDGLELEIPGNYSYYDIKKSINNLYGTGNFNRAYFNLEDSYTGKDLNIKLDEEKTWNINIGMRVNSTSAISIVLNSTRRDYTKTFGMLSFTTDISSNPRINFTAELDKKEMPKLSLMIDGMYKSLSVHLDKNQAFPSEIYVVSAKILTSQRVSKNSVIGSGIKQEYFNGKLYTIVSDSAPTVTTNEKSISNFFVNMTYDNLDDYYFPTKGTEAFSELSLAQDKGFHTLNPIMILKVRSVIKLNKNFSLLLNAYGRSILSETTPAQLGNFVGGHDYEIFLDHILPFYGLPSIWPTGKYSFVGLTGFRLNLAERHYITIAGNYLVNSNEFYPFDNYKTVWGSGLSYSYKSTIGPIELTVGYSDKNKKPTLSANAGFWF
jgi:NTE family protein